MQDEQQVTSGYVDRAGLEVAVSLAAFIEERALPGTGIDAPSFWTGAAHILETFATENARLLDVRNQLQTEIDAWHVAHNGGPLDPVGYRAMLEAIGYIEPVPAPFSIDPDRVDAEIASTSGPQLVVPVLNARFLLNAANARWGSLYDALYGTDALGSLPIAGPYDADRGQQVVARAKAFLNEAVPLQDISHDAVDRYHIEDGALVPALADPSQLIGYNGSPAAPEAILLRHHGLHIEILLDRSSPIGSSDPAGVADVVLEAAITTIADLEDSIAAVDAEDKVAAYSNWLDLMQGTLEATFDKAGRSVVRTLASDRVYTGLDGAPLVLPGRSLLFIRNVGHLMTTPAVRLGSGNEAPEGILDAIVTVLAGIHDLRSARSRQNSRAGSIYIVKPKMHGSVEAAFTDRLFDAVEDLFSLPRHTIKIGLMDEERRTSVNLAACIAAVRHRLVFINTGFLDRTGDEIHTSMRAGPMLPKAEIRGSDWIGAYEDRNVLIGLQCGLAGKAQIGKGMWAMPDRMAEMLAQKSAHPQSGASTAWVPSPTAATLHAMHYHQVDVSARQRARITEAVPSLDLLLTPPLAIDRTFLAAEIEAELDNNAQGILGYVVRWVDQGIGCSKVPDIHDVGLMEDRATLRISSQHMANWLLHGLVTKEQVLASLERMARQVDAQNIDDDGYRPMTLNLDHSAAFQAACALVLEGAAQPSGYTECLLHRFRREVKGRVPEQA